MKSIGYLSAIFSFGAVLLSASPYDAPTPQFTPGLQLQRRATSSSPSASGTPLAGQGSACTSSAQCATGFLCRASQCRAQKAYAAACQSDYDCSSSYCYNNRCAISTTSGPKVGAPYHCHTDYNCGGAALCYGQPGVDNTDSFLCVKTNTALVATKCTSASTCGSGAGCRNGYCYPYKGPYDPCLINSDCSTGSCLSDSLTCAATGSPITPSTTPTPTPTAPGGAPLGGVNATCSVDGDCYNTLSCRANRCLAQKAYNAACSTDYECTSSWCLNGKCAISTTSGPKVAVPSHCHTDYNCGSAALCYGGGTPNATDSFVCVKTSTTVVTTKCSTSANCPAGAGCRTSSGYCYPYKNAYDPCLVDTDCSSGSCITSSLTCAPPSATASPTATPTPLKSQGAPCSQTSECLSPLSCRSGKCLQQKVNGGACTTDYDCVSSWCLNSKCTDSTTSGPKVAVPGHCHTDYNCGSAALCYGSDPDNTDSLVCVKTNTTVTATKCTSAAQCPSNSGCRSGSCYTFKGPGDPCKLDSDCSTSSCLSASLTCAAAPYNPSSSTLPSNVDKIGTLKYSTAWCAGFAGNGSVAAVFSGKSTCDCFKPGQNSTGVTLCPGDTSAACLEVDTTSGGVVTKNPQCSTCSGSDCSTLAVTNLQSKAVCTEAGSLLIAKVNGECECRTQAYLDSTGYTSATYVSCSAPINAVAVCSSITSYDVNTNAAATSSCSFKCNAGFALSTDGLTCVASSGPTTTTSRPTTTTTTARTTTTTTPPPTNTPITAVPSGAVQVSTNKYTPGFCENSYGAGSVPVLYKYSSGSTSCSCSNAPGQPTTGFSACPGGGNAACIHTDSMLSDGSISSSDQCTGCVGNDCSLYTSTNLQTDSACQSGTYLYAIQNHDCTCSTVGKLYQFGIMNPVLCAAPSNSFATCSSIQASNGQHDGSETASAACAFTCAGGLINNGTACVTSQSSSQTTSTTLSTTSPSTGVITTTTDSTTSTTSSLSPTPTPTTPSTTSASTTTTLSTTTTVSVPPPPTNTPITSLPYNSVQGSTTKYTTGFCQNVNGPGSSAILLQYDSGSSGCGCSTTSGAPDGSTVTVCPGGANAACVVTNSIQAGSSTVTTTAECTDCVGSDCFYQTSKDLEYQAFCDSGKTQFTVLNRDCICSTPSDLARFGITNYKSCSPPSGASSTCSSIQTTNGLNDGSDQGSATCGIQCLSGYTLSTDGNSCTAPPAMGPFTTLPADADYESAQQYTNAYCVQNHGSGYVISAYGGTCYCLSPQEQTYYPQAVCSTGACTDTRVEHSGGYSSGGGVCNLSPACSPSTGCSVYSQYVLQAPGEQARGCSASKGLKIYASGNNCGCYSPSDPSIPREFSQCPIPANGRPACLSYLDLRQNGGYVSSIACLSV